MAPTLLLDGFNLAYRSFYAIPELNRSDGFPTNALHGWVKTVWRLEDLYPDSRLLAFFDLGHDEEKSALLPEYKANRAEMPEALDRQFPRIKELSHYLGLGVAESEGIEADDLIASAAARLHGEGKEALIVSADKDLAQCIQSGVAQLLPPPTANPKLGWRTLDEAAVREKYGIRPDQVADYLALIGDSSDNIPGIAGVGPKTAAKWLQAYGDLEAVLTNAGRLRPPRFQAVVTEQADQLRRNRQLTTLHPDHEVDLAPGHAEPARLRSFLEEMEMASTAREIERRYPSSS